MRLTVVIPCRDRLESLSRCLQSVAASMVRLHASAGSTDIRVRVVVVDDRSSCGFREVVHASFPWAEIIDSEGVGPGAARNTALADSDTDCFLFIDSDCVAHGDWLVEAARWQGQSPDLVAQGVPWLFQCRQNPKLGALEQRLYRLLFSSYVRGGASTQLDSRNMLVTREHVQRHGAALFDTTISDAAAESRVGAERLRNWGVSVCWLPGLKVLHEDPEDYAAVWRQKYRHGRGRVHVWEPMPVVEEMLERYFVHPVADGIPFDYVGPAHLAFLTGYRDQLDPSPQTRRWWEAVCSSLEARFPSALHWRLQVEETVACSTPSARLA